MLLEFSVKNFKSIKEKQTLSLVANTSKELMETNTFSTGLNNIPTALRSVVIYGPNAAGKSNIILAMKFVETTILSSSKETQAGDKFEITPFLFDDKTATEPSEFEVHFIQNGIRYQYGFALTPDKIVNEWLLAYPKGRPQSWFERKFNLSENKSEWSFGSFFKGNRELIADATRINALFLSTAIQLNNEHLKPIYEWFQKTLAIISSPYGVSDFFTKNFCEKRKLDVMKFLKTADLSIQDIKLETRPESEFVFPANFPAELKESVLAEERTSVKVGHAKNDTADVFLDLKDESEGTKKLFALAGPWLDILSEGRVVFVDKLNNSLHPLMVKHLVGLLNNPELNKANAQLVFTTHDTSLLDANIFRRDQIWFVEKDNKNSTHLYPLAEFSPRKGEALGNGYMKGRYGALPFIGELKFNEE
jgi:uncharacterized protein